MTPNGHSPTSTSVEQLALLNSTRSLIIFFKFKNKKSFINYIIRNTFSQRKQQQQQTQKRVFATMHSISNKTHTSYTHMHEIIHFILLSHTKIV